MTRADNIRCMSDNELVDFLMNLATDECGDAIYYNGEFIGEIRTEILAWLEQEEPEESEDLIFMKAVDSVYCGCVTVEELDKRKQSMLKFVEEHSRQFTECLQDENGFLVENIFKGKQNNVYNKKENGRN